ncbi:MAG: zinc ribbon domain-containing protein [Promethearchaeota archaeon]|nr:MAG: zinc ribbon domain-containing protein [Candidatus Lokiarchaeota archaeon]
MKLQDTTDEDSINKKAIWNMELGTNLMKNSVFIMCVESWIGNIIFNVGLHKIYKGFTHFPLNEIYIIPIRTVRIYNQPTQKYIDSRNQRFRQEIEYGRKSPTYTTNVQGALRNQNNYNTPTSHQVLVDTPVFCGNCGLKLYSSTANFCSYCGNRRS